MNFSYRDAKKLLSQVWHQDELLNKKRRWLMGPSMTSMVDGRRKKFKRPKFLTDVFLPESCVRSDEVSYEIVRTEVEKNFGAHNDTHRTHHVVQDFFQLFDSYSSNPTHFLKKFCSMMNALSNRALCFIAILITEKEVGFEKTRPKLKNIIKCRLPKFLDKTSSKDYPKLMEQLFQIFKDPNNFREKRLSIYTPITTSLRSSIQKALTLLDKMPLQDLIAMNRKLSEVTVIPKFPPTRFRRTKNELLELVNRRCQKIIATLEDKHDLPKPFAKALSIMQLSLKQRTKCFHVNTLEFYPFSSEIVGLQNDILRALWSLQKVRTRELKSLQHFVDPKANVPIKGLRISLRKYLLEYLFECDTVDIGEDVLNIIATLNRRSRRRARLFTTEMIDEDVEGTLIISSQLKRTVSDITEYEVETLESDYSSESNDFDIAEGGNVYNTKDGEEGSAFCDEAHGTEESMGTNYTMNDIKSESVDFTYNDTHMKAAYVGGDFIKKSSVLEQADNMDFVFCNFSKKSNLEGENENTSEHLHEEAGISGMRDTLIQEICDETSLVAYKLIGYMLDKWIQVEGRGSDEMTRYYLRGGSSLETRGSDEPLKASKDATESEVLIQSLQELLPNMSKSCLEKVKKLME